MTENTTPGRHVPMTQPSRDHVPTSIAHTTAAPHDCGGARVVGGVTRCKHSHRGDGASAANQGAWKALLRGHTSSSVLASYSRPFFMTQVISRVRLMSCRG